jgi:hypothetical protein
MLAFPNLSVSTLSTLSTRVTHAPSILHRKPEEISGLVRGFESDPCGNVERVERAGFEQAKLLRWLGKANVYCFNDGCGKRPHAR